MGMVHGAYDRFDPIERFCGGNYKKLHDIFDKFFEVLTNAGGKLVFFGDGPIHESKVHTWFQRRNVDYTKCCTIFDVVDNASLNMIANFVFKKIEFSPSMKPAFMDLIQLCKKYGIFRVAIGMECDTRIAKYATENNALAVFGNDTDYVIYEGNWRYWSVKDLDLINQNWNTFEFNKEALRDYLNLSDKDMILFSVICGNDVIPYKCLRRLHKRIHQRYNNNDCDRYNKIYFLDIAKYVKMFSNSLTVAKIQLLSEEIFSSQSDENLALIYEAIKFYDINIETQFTDLLLQQAAIHNDVFYGILDGLPYSFSLPLYDLRRNDFLPFHEIVFPLLARQVGLIRQHKNEKSYLQIVETKISHDAPFTTINLYPEYPPSKIF